MLIPKILCKDTKKMREKPNILLTFLSTNYVSEILSFYFTTFLVVPSLIFITLIPF